MARPTKLTPELQADLVRALASGAYIEAACEYVGIAPATYYGWIARANAEDAEPEFLEFLEAVKKARAANIRRHIKIIRKAGKEQWQASAWFLERRDAKNFGKKEVEELVALRKEVAEMKAKPCADCGGTFPPECMDFDHVRGEKIGDISKMLLRTTELLHEEIAKCDVVCANCHRIRTHQARTLGRAIK
jgi:hypothetical protein